MSVRYLLPVVHNSHTPQWWLSYVEVDGWRWAFRGGGE